MEPHACNCGEGHSNTDLGVHYNLFSKIDFENFECLNEEREDTGKSVFRPWEERLDRNLFVDSDVDDDLLFNIPFTGNIKLKGIIVVGGIDGTHPAKVKMYKNRPKMTFGDTEIAEDQAFDLYEDVNGIHEYPVKVVKFSSVQHLTLHFTGNFGGENTRINYIGLKGEWSQAHQHGVTLCVYESRPQISDHRTSSFDMVGKEIQ